MNLKLLFGRETEEDDETEYTLDNTCDETNPVSGVLGDACFKSPIYKDRGCYRARGLYGP